MLAREQVADAEVLADAEGRAPLDSVEPGDLDSVRVAAAGYGTQVIRVAGLEREPVVTLLPAGRVEGRLEAEDPAAVRGLTLHLRTGASPTDDADRVGGEAEVVSDDQGRFVAPLIAEGNLAVFFEPRPDQPFHGNFLGRPVVSVGQTTTVSIALERRALVRGVVRDVTTGKPIAGVGISMEAAYRPSLVLTDAEGRYACYGDQVAVPLSVPPEYLFGVPTIRTEPIPPGIQVFEAKPIALARGVPLLGRVVDLEGNPVPGANVESALAGPRKQTLFALGITDQTGRFRIDGIPAGTDVTLVSRKRDGVTTHPTNAIAGRDPVTLTLDPSAAIAIAGSVVDPAGRPVAGALVRLASRRSAPGATTPGSGGWVELDDHGRDRIRTDASGRFQTPRWLSSDFEYQAEVDAPGFAVARSDWLGPARSREFPPLILNPLEVARTLLGRVVDAHDLPVAGASVFQSGDGPRRTRTVTDAEGRFRLPGVYRDSAFLFIEGPGLRLVGRPVEPGDTAATYRAVRVGDPPSKSWRTLPPPWPRDRSRALALKLLEPEIAKLERKEPGATLSPAAFSAFGRLDPTRALQFVEQRRITDEIEVRYLRFGAALGLLDAGSEPAADVIERFNQPELRARFAREACDAAAAGDLAAKLAWLDRALVQARAVGEPASKLNELGRVGTRLLDLGELERGTAVLREAQAIAESLPRLQPNGRVTAAMLARGQFASSLARIDAAAALAIAAEATGSAYQSRFLVGVAESLALADPAAAEQALALVEPAATRSAVGWTTIGRIARLDLERARRLAEAISNPSDKAMTLAAIGRALVRVDPKTSANLFIEALDLLNQSGMSPRNVDDPASKAASFLPVIERLGDPVVFEQCFWKAVALRPARAPEGDPRGVVENQLGLIAAGLARYDRDVARRVLEPAARRARAILSDRIAQPVNQLHDASALVDPAWAESILASLPDDSPRSAGQPKARARQEVAWILSFEEQRTWRVVDHLLGRFDSDDPFEINY
jgi:hypothetical protein